MNKSVLLFRDVKALANKERAEVMRKFFKTGEGEYGEGDIFLGLSVPQCRLLAKKYSDLSYGDTAKVLESHIHEERLIALLILVEQFKKLPGEREYIFHFYLTHTKFINNWDLIDLSAENIIGKWLLQEGKVFNIALLTKLAKSSSVWERRIAIMSTFQFIKNGRSEETFRLAGILIQDKHDLIHKAVGWMLREAGKRCSEEAEERFLKKHYKTMPRTMLRYAIERFSEEKRLLYMKGEM